MADIIELLKRAGSCYAAAIHISPKDPRGHVGLGTVMEELFYVADMYGFKETEVVQWYYSTIYTICVIVGSAVVLQYFNHD